MLSRSGGYQRARGTAASGQAQNRQAGHLFYDLIYDVLRKYEPDHLLLEAAWADARARLTDVGRLGNLLDRAADTMLHVESGTGQSVGSAAAGNDRAGKRGAGVGR